MSTKGNQKSEILLPEREYGYAMQPYQWSDLVDIIERQRNLAKLARSVEQETEYQIYRRNLHKEWKSVFDHILHSKFSFEKRLVRHNDSAVWEAYPPLSETKTVRKVLVPNDFPYYNAPEIEHWILWQINQDIVEEDVVQAKADLGQLLGDVQAMLHWINPPHLKSLPEIDHVHILCLRGSATPIQSGGRDIPT